MDAGSHVPDDRPERAGSAPGEQPGRQASRVTSDSLDAVDYLFIFGGPIAFGALAYFISRHVSDDAYGA